MSRLVIAALVVIATACASPGDPATETGAPAPSNVGLADLDDIVVGPGDPPEGMSHDTTAEGKDALTQVVISGRNADFVALPGFQKGLSHTFSGESGALLSLALAFDSAENAAGALDLFIDELQSEAGFGFGPAERDAGLGDEGTCQEGTNPALGDLQESICIWRHENAVLIVGGPIAPTAVRAVADAMDSAAGE